MFGLLSTINLVVFQDGNVVSSFAFSCVCKGPLCLPEYNRHTSAGDQVLEF